MATPLKVAVIGGGPGAMFFCHSYHKMKQSGNIQQPLEITCFEKKESPGGVWRAASSKTENGGGGGNCSPTSTSSSASDNDGCRIYDELWTNGPSACIEFYDYTFAEHFGVDKSLPMYFPRKDVHEYIVGRCLKENPSFFEDFFQCNTEVVNVEFDETTQEFAVTLKDTISSSTSTEFFDKCVWAGGENGIKSIPKSLREMFPQNDSASGDSNGSSNGNTPMKSKQPLLLHSTETHIIREHCKDNTILLIGGSYSAEDLALQCLKWGAKMIHISTRDQESAVTWTTSWPSSKVSVHNGVALQSVCEEDGSINFERVRWQWPGDYVRVARDYDSDDDSVIEEKKEQDYQRNERPPALTLREVGMVIFCTGYRPNLNMLSPSLKPTNDTIPQWYMGDNLPFQSEKLNEEWRMDDDPVENPAHDFTGHVPPNQGRMLHLHYNHPDLYRGVLFKNPNMMFLCEHGFDVPLMSLDVHAWLLCSWLTNRVEMPTIETLRAANEQQVLDQLNVPYLRYCLDEGYCSALDNIEEEGFWSPSDEEEEDNCAWWDCQRQYSKYCLRLLAKVMEEGQYPGASLGSYQKLNDNGLAIDDFNYRCYWNRTTRENDSSSERTWKTFRDDTFQPPHCYSLYTKTKARPLTRKWLDASGPVSIRNGDV